MIKTYGLKLFKRHFFSGGNLPVTVSSKWQVAWTLLYILAAPEPDIQAFGRWGWVQFKGPGIGKACPVAPCRIISPCWSGGGSIGSRNLIFSISHPFGRIPWHVISPIRRNTSGLGAGHGSPASKSIFKIGLAFCGIVIRSIWII